MTKIQKVSIITVSYNAATTIEATLKSVISQNRADLELDYIVVDGGSTDGTPRIINKYRSDISTIISESDTSIYHAMNKGIVRAKGDIVGFLNADDIYAHKNILKKVVNGFNVHSIDCLYGDLIYFQETPANIKRYWRASEFKPGLFAKGWNPPHPTFFVKKSIYQQYGGFDLSLPIANDIELMMRFLEKFRIRSYYMPEVLVKMRLGGLSNSSWKTIFRQNKAILTASKSIGLPISPLTFCIGKLIDRVKQRVILS